MGFLKGYFTASNTSFTIQCPLLCKEFVIDAWQIYYARTKGADAILLIAAVLPDLDIRYMTKICKMLGLTALVEVWMLLLSCYNCNKYNDCRNRK